MFIITFDGTHTDADLNAETMHVAVLFINVSSACDWALSFPDVITVWLQRPIN